MALEEVVGEVDVELVLNLAAAAQGACSFGLPAIRLGIAMLGSWSPSNSSIGGLSNCKMKCSETSRRKVRLNPAGKQNGNLACWERAKK
jgi:hypothetical protein